MNFDHSHIIYELKELTETALDYFHLLENNPESLRKKIYINSVIKNCNDCLNILINPGAFDNESLEKASRILIIHMTILQQVRALKDMIEDDTKNLSNL